jgi:hypothetical protein
MHLLEILSKMQILMKIKLLIQFLILKIIIFINKYYQLQVFPHYYKLYKMLKRFRQHLQLIHHLLE